MKHSLSKKREAVKKWVENPSLALKALSREIGVPRTTLRKWLLKEGVYHTRWIGSRPQLDEISKKMAPLVQKAFRFTSFKECKLSLKHPTKILVADDFHIPFLDLDVLKTMLASDGDASYLLTGEIVNFDAISRFLHLSDQSLEIEDDVAGGLLEEIGKKMEVYVLTMANHTQRFLNYLAVNLGSKSLDYLVKLVGLEGLLPEFFRKTRVHAVPGKMVQVGGLIYSHSEFFSSIPGRSAQWELQRLENYASAFGFDEYNCVAMGHTHNLVSGFYYEKAFFEVGCLCHLLPFMFTGRPHASLRYFRWVNGYVVIETQKNGMVDLRRSRAVFVKFSTLPKGIKEEPLKGGKRGKKKEKTENFSQG